MVCFYSNFCMNGKTCNISQGRLAPYGVFNQKANGVFQSNSPKDTIRTFFAHPFLGDD